MLLSCLRRAGCALALAGVLGAVSAGVVGPAPVVARSPLLRCDAPFPLDGRAPAATRHNCWLREDAGPRPVPWPAPDAFAEGSVVTVYSLRWRTGAPAPRLYCSAESARGHEYDRWFAAAAVRGASTTVRASYGVDAGSVPARDRVVASFVGGRGRVAWERDSRYDAAGGRWVASAWRPAPSSSANPPPPPPDFFRAPETVEGPPPPAGGTGRGRSGYTCPEAGLLARQLGDVVDDGAGSPDRLPRCLQPPTGAGELFDGDRLNVQAQYLPGAGRFGPVDADDEDEEEDERDGGSAGRQPDRTGSTGSGRSGGPGSNPGQDDDPGGGDPGSDGIPDEPGCGGENNAVCNEDPDDTQDPDGRNGRGGNPNTETPQPGQGQVVNPQQADGSRLGSGRRLADAPVVVAFSSGMTCVERESIVLRRYARRDWVDTSHDEYDPACDLGAAVPPIGDPLLPPGLRPAYCGAQGFDPAGWRRVPSGYWNTWWEHVWEPNPAETDPHFPWARVFWQDGGGRPAFESGGVVLGDDGSGVCLIDKGFVRNPALPGVVPAIATYLAGAWTDYGRSVVGVRCPKEDGTAGLTALPAGAGAPAFGVTVSLDFPPAVHEQALGESYALEQYRAMRDCADWPADAAEPPVPGVDCGVALPPASPARQRRLDSHRRRVGTGPSSGRIAAFRLAAAARMLSPAWAVRRAAGLAGRLELDTPWDGGPDVGAGRAAEAREFGPPLAAWADCGRRDFLIGDGPDSLWGAWIARAEAGRSREAAGAAALLALARGLDPRNAVGCTPGGVCTPDPAALLAHHQPIEDEARRLRDDRRADPARVCGIGDRGSRPGP